MKRLAALVLVAALVGGCVTSPEEAHRNADGTVDLTAVQDGWASFSLDLDYALSSQRDRDIITEAEFDEQKDRQRDWWGALVLFNDAALLDTYYDAGWWDGFIGAVYWSADDRGHIRDRNAAEDYDELVREVLQ